MQSELHEIVKKVSKPLKVTIIAYFSDATLRIILTANF